MRLVPWLVLSFVLCPTPDSVGTDATEGQDRTEYDLKSAFLFNFVRYTLWPKKAFETKGSPFVVAVVGKNPFGDRLERTFSGKKFVRREIVIERYETIKDVKKPHLLFLGALSDEDRDALLKRLADQPVLLIGEQPGFAHRGGIVRLYLKDKRIAFQVNTAAMKIAGIKIGAELLKHGEIVKQ